MPYSGYSCKVKYVSLMLCKHSKNLVRYVRYQTNVYAWSVTRDDYGVFELLHSSGSL